MQTQAHGHYLETLKVPVLFDCMFCSSLHIGCNPSVHTHTHHPPSHKWWFDVGQTWTNSTWKVDLNYLGTLPILRICCGSDIVEAWRIFVLGIRSRPKPSTFGGHFAKKREHANPTVQYWVISNTETCWMLCKNSLSKRTEGPQVESDALQHAIIL